MLEVTHISILLLMALNLYHFCEDSFHYLTKMTSKGDHVAPRGTFPRSNQLPAKPSLAAVEEDVVEDVIITDEERCRGPRGPRGRDGKDGKDGCDGKDGKHSKEGASDTIYVPIFLRIPDVEADSITLIGSENTVTTGAPNPANLPNDASWIEDPEQGDEVWGGVTPDVKGVPSKEPFYFSYNDGLIATDSTTGLPVKPYPGERRPKGYRIGNLTNEPFIRGGDLTEMEEQEVKADSVFYFDYRATLHRRLNKNTEDDKEIISDEGKYDYYLNFEPFELDFACDRKGEIPTQDRPIVNFTHLVKDEWELFEDLHQPPDEPTEQDEPALDKSSQDDLAPTESEFGAHPHYEYRVVLVSTQEPNTFQTAFTAATNSSPAVVTVLQGGADPVVLTHSTDISAPSFRNAVDGKAGDFFRVRVLPRAWLQAYIGIKPPRVTTLTYVATVNASVSGKQTLLQSVNCAGTDRGTLSFSLDPQCDLTGFVTSPPPKLTTNFAMAPCRLQGDYYPGLTVGIPCNDPLANAILGGSNCVGQVTNKEIAWDEENPCGLVKLGTGTYAGCAVSLYNSAGPWNAEDLTTQDVAVCIKFDYFDQPIRRRSRHRHRNTRVVLSRGGRRGGFGSYGLGR